MKDNEIRRHISEYFGSEDEKFLNAASRLNADGYSDADIRHILAAAFNAGYGQGVFDEASHQ